MTHEDFSSYIGSANLSVRPGEQIHIFEDRPDQADCYVVMLMETPAFPGKQHEESANLSVLAAAIYPTIEGKSGNEPRWGWVQMDGETKEMIGDALVRLGANPGQWYYLLITGGIGHRPIEHVNKILGKD